MRGAESGSGFDGSPHRLIVWEPGTTLVVGSGVALAKVSIGLLGLIARPARARI